MFWSILPLFLLWSLVEARGPLRDPPAYHSGTDGLWREGNGYEWAEEYFKQMPLDHFAFANKDSFALRYFINLKSYKTGGPILFYTGNEGSLEGFAENTGFMWDLAPELGAAVVFAEHRFYGKSQPFKNESYTSTDRLGYLSSEQALADFAVLIDYLKTTRIPGAEKSAVVAFGGSYGGMLSAWMRIKYPHIIDGAIAASAPVFWFEKTSLKEDVYDKIVKRAFLSSGCKESAITKGWKAIQKLSNSDDGRIFLNNIFKLEKKSLLMKPDDAQFLINFIKEVFEGMAMVNYPYPTSFLAKLPGWPVKEACKFLTNVGKSDEDSARQLYQVTNLYYNYTGETKSLCADSSKCSGAYEALGDPLGWPWQTCTEMVMPICSSGSPNDFFLPDCPFTNDKYFKYCTDTFGSIGYNASMFRPDWAMQNYGSRFPSASNIVFSNGFLDPWSGGGWSFKTKTEGSLVSIIIKEGAHHYDLRGTHPQDTEEIKKVREQEKQHILKWIKKAEMRRFNY